MDFEEYDDEDGDDKQRMQFAGFDLVPCPADGFLRVDDPMLSIVATRRRADRRSGASVPKSAPCAFEFIEFGD
jgi:hypothetical protein